LNELYLYNTQLIIHKTVSLHYDQPLANAGAFGVEPVTYDTAGNVLTSGEKNSPLLQKRLDGKHQFANQVRLVFQLS